MLDPTSGRESRRALADGLYALSLLTFAVVAGHAILAPSVESGAEPIQAATRAERVAAVTVPAVSGAVDASARAIERAALPAEQAATPTGSMATPTPDARDAAAPSAGGAETRAPAVTASIVPAQPAAIPPAREPDAELRLAPTPTGETWPSSTVTGRVVNRDGKPLAGASVVVRGIEVTTDAEGRFTVDRVAPDASLLVKLPGYAKTRVAPTRKPVEVTLKPQVIKAAYLTYYGIGSRTIRERVLDLTARSELNAVVIDVKGDRGWILYPTEVPLAQAAGAQGPGTLRDFDTLMADLKARGIYTIARIVTFKDNVLANHRPDLAIIDTRTGRPWIDREQLAWVDPFREEVWAYNIAIAKEAARRGFDEVQFDYVRFPTDGKLSAARYSKPNSKDTRLPAIAGFLERARREIGPTGAFVAADIFGYTAFNENDTDIGQRVEELAPHLDFICPMVYPSGYHKGIPGHPNPVAVPYKVVHESVRLIRKRAVPHVAQVRPWLQDFRDYAFGRKLFGVAEVQAQIRGSEEAGGSGWMLWNPRNVYTGEALRLDQNVAQAR
ncbi:MAG TPA: putative glycoside hydrolase [Candidatus Tectomicrobia bacterium]|nr:putative glycoside hydrolase [Candidatus Tectomicrobia bacterium]